jgi:hypothetical protein
LRAWSTDGYLYDVGDLFGFLLLLKSAYLELSNELPNIGNGLKFYRIFICQTQKVGIYGPFPVFDSSFESPDYAEYKSENI